MSYILRHLPPLIELKKILKEDPSMIDIYIKCDSFIGDSESIEYILSIVRDRVTPKKQKIINKIIKPFAKKNSK
jgi:hypothetical protein